MRRSALVVVLLVAVAAPGCLKRQLRYPVEDHRVLTSTIAQKHERGDYAGDPKALQDDLDAMAEQARLLDSIVKGENPTSEGDQ
ncbi:MAG: hypothetical protein KAJ42_14765 [Gemmatimonadetes bacterium]|nr:hypothetical protein [Gemmatimonadota bacterium]